MLQAPIIRAIAFNLCAAAVWPLLPLLARDVLKTTATGYGLMLAAFGLGSIVAALVLPRLRNRFALDRILACGSILASLAYFGISIVRSPWLAGLCLFFRAGHAWGVLVNFNVAVQPPCRIGSAGAPWRFTCSRFRACWRRQRLHVGMAGRADRYPAMFRCGRGGVAGGPDA